MDLDTHEHFRRVGRSDTYLGELVELNQSDTYISELDKLSKLSDTTLKLSELSGTKVKMFGILKKSSNEKSQQQAIFHSSSKNLLNTFDEFVTVQERLRKPHERPNQRCREQSRPSRDVADQRRHFLQFDVQEICDNFEKEMMKIFKDVSKIHKKSTSTRAHATEPSLFISEKPKSKSENSLEDLKDFSNSFPIFDDYDEKLMESLITCEDECDLPSPKPDLMFDIDNKETNGLTYFEPEHLSSLVLVSQVFAEEPLDYPQQGPRLDTRISLDDDPDHIFDVEDELGPIFDEEAPSITSINMENHLFFDPGTTPTPLSKEHCEKLDLLNSMPEMFVKISSQDDKRFGFDKLDSLCVETDKPWHNLRSMLENCIVLSFDVILVYNALFEKYFELLISDSRSELNLLCSDFEKAKNDLKLLNIISCLDTILDKQVQSQRNESSDRAYQPEFWKSMYLRNGAVHGCRRDDPISSQRPRKLDDQFRLFPTLQAVEESYRKSTYTSPFSRYEAVSQKPIHSKEIPARPKTEQLSSLSHETRENQTKEAAKSSPQRKPLEQVILNEPKVILQSIPCQSQKHCKDHELIVSAYHENVLNTSISLRKQIFTWYEPKFLGPENHFDFVHVEKFSKLTLSHSFPISLKALLAFKTSKPIFGTQFTCLKFTHVLDDYPKSLDPVFDVLRIEKPFDYFFRRFDVVSLVVLKEQVKRDQFSKRASKGGHQRSYVSGTWNWKYLRKTS
ncbi:hypothetical protein F2Q68_00044111 [Brassica cretica]|uniref:Uncharacterized protein n=1 Tax=Brassica cretica TaxID=69181 RepID=A0A8S9LIT3_BRACR|nr:hypothetical protein F2Q68_00044111 [Brassica cretica]